MPVGLLIIGLLINPALTLIFLIFWPQPEHEPEVETETEAETAGRNVQLDEPPIHGPETRAGRILCAGLIGAGILAIMIPTIIAATA